jgi:hypothetical protein
VSKIVFLVGEPGVGKSTLMAETFGHLERAAVDHRAAGGPMRELLWNGPQLVGCELGRRMATAGRTVFPGTDAMSQTAIVGVDEWLRQGADDLGFVALEGTRLANKRFVTAAMEGGHSLDLFYLYGPETARARRAERGLHQDERWVKGRQTAAANFYQLCNKMRAEHRHLNTLILKAGRPTEVNREYLLAMAGLAAPVSR